MSLVGAFKIIDSLEDLFRDYRGMNTKDVVNSLRELRFEIIEEFSKKDDPRFQKTISSERKSESEGAPTPPEKELTAEDIKLAAVKQSKNFPEFVVNVEKMYNQSNSELAKMFGVSDAAICCWKSGKSSPNKDSRQMICRTLQSRLGIPIEVSRFYLHV